MADCVAEHAVTLLALNGREKDVLLRVTREGVVLVTASDGKEFNRFPYAVVKKWLPSNLRSRNPGPDDCLDLQIQTDKGARDLRMRCHGTSSVLDIIEQLRQTVTDIMIDMRQSQHAPSHATHTHEQAAFERQDTMDRSSNRTSAQGRDGQEGERVSQSRKSDPRGAAEGHSSMTISATGGAAQGPVADAGVGGVAAAMQAGPSPSRHGPSSGHLHTRGASPASGVLSTQDLSSIPGAIPVTVLGALPSPGRSGETGVANASLGHGGGLGTAGSTLDALTGGSTLDALAAAGVTQLILATAPTGSLPGYVLNTSNDGGVGGRTGSGRRPSGPARLQRPGLASSLLGSFGLRPAHVSTGDSDPGAGEAGGGPDDELQVSSRMGSFGPAYMNAAFAGSGTARGGGGGGGLLAGRGMDGVGDGGDGGPSSRRRSMAAPALISEMRSQELLDAQTQQALDLAMASRLSPSRKESAAVAAAAAKQRKAEAQAASLHMELDDLAAQNKWVWL